MKKKKKKAGKTSTNIEDFVKAVKKADREVQLSSRPGFVSTNKVHKNKKIYDRKADKKNYLDEE